MAQPVDAWQSGQSYEQFMGRWSVLIAKQFLEWLSVARYKAWMEVGCGTGAISGLIRQSKQPRFILAIDSSSKFISFAREKHQDGPIHFGVGLAQSLPTVTGYFDAVVSGLVLNFIPEPLHALEQMRRVTRPGGVVAAYIWDYAEGMQMLRYFWDAAVALEPHAAELDEGLRFPLCRQGNLEKLFKSAGFRDIQSRPLEATAIFSSFEDYWQPFLGGVGPAPGYVASLDADQKHALQRLLKQSLPVAPDGSITVSNRAWAVQGRV